MAENKINTEKMKIRTQNKPICGLVMPISEIDGCSESHWKDVRGIITEAVKSIEEVEFEIKLVSEAEETTIIQKTIIQNVFDNGVIICDVSGKNPNVMFELGMRFAFDKPVVIVKDDVTDYSFDTGNIRHVPYPRDLRYQKIIDFQKDLANRLLKTYKGYQENQKEASLLKDYGKFKIAELEETTISSEKLMINLFEDIKSELNNINRQNRSFTRIKRNLIIDNDLEEKITVIMIEFIKRFDITSSNELLENGKFLERIERITDAPSCFSSFREFKDFIEPLITRLFLEYELLS
ncbi:MAG: hypothetical protein JEZ00_15620 [Anaerolineaceae bacterium]|nr:hypothetical protein [Anaerolineaceae bacterium]